MKKEALLLPEEIQALLQDVPVASRSGVLQGGGSGPSVLRRKEGGAPTRAGKPFRPVPKDFHRPASGTIEPLSEGRQGKPTILSDLEAVATEVKSFRQAYDRWIKQLQMSLACPEGIRPDPARERDAENWFDHFDNWERVFHENHLPFSGAISEIREVCRALLDQARKLYWAFYRGEHPDIVEYRLLVGHELGNDDGGLNGYFLRRVDSLLDQIHTVQCSIDFLTGIPNRLLLDGPVPNVRSPGDRACLLAFDIDHFKRINDTYGHLVGDAVLCEVAHQLQKNVRSGDQGLALRVGGDEFLIIGHMGPRGAVRLAERLRSVIENRFCSGFSFGGKEFPDLRVTVSVGLAPFPPGLVLETSFEIARQVADEALYRAKEDGRNRVAFSQAPQANTPDHRSP